MSQESEDEELIHIFIEEAKELLDAIAMSLQKWSTDLTDKTIFAALKRDLHTLKGGARMVSQPILGTLAHELESLCDFLLNTTMPIERKHYDLICAGQDRMNVLVDLLATQKPLLGIEDLVAQFKAAISGVEKPIQEEALPAQKKEPAKTSKEPEVTSETTNEVIRIKSDLLESLNNLSIENNIIRVNVSHYVDKIKLNLNEIMRLIKVFQEKASKNSGPYRPYSISDILGLFEACKSAIQIHSNVESLLSQQSRVSLELQERLIDTRMISFSSIVPRLSRTVRQVASELKKKIDFNVLQAEGEIDRNLLDHIVPSLEHLLRNSLDHGIESAEERLKQNKPEVGKINLRFFRMGHEACMEISDDGAGINVEAVKRKAIKLGLLAEDAKYSNEELIRFIFEPGFSTKEHISEISGRGVGMDVVNTVVKALGGNLSIESQTGKGTKCVIRAPFTTSMNRALLVTVKSQIFGILLSTVENIVLLDVKRIKEALKKQEVIVYNNKEYHLKYLGEVLGLEDNLSIPSNKESLPVLFFNFADYNAALLVDSLIGSQEVVVQTLGPQFKLMDMFSGATLLADGRVIIILDAYSMALERRKLGEIMERQVGAKREFTILVVDDSITIRTVTKNFLERHKYHVLTAKDGLDALEKVAVEKPDLVLLDLEMPRMDGFQFAEKFRSDIAHSSIPIIMITFCTGDTEKARAKQLGINMFINKPYKEPDLLEAVEQLLEIK